MTNAVEVRGISKSYWLSHQGGGQHSYTALRDVLADGARRLLRRSKTEERDWREEFWALRDVTFDIAQGDRIGIIGRNGAGKSTLLKILSRITAPTTGKITMWGRAASLLEVGTGFHPELTGRENIYLNGAILGMSRAEIKRKFDEIVAFADVERFLDTPVKRYSSGMYVRLAFAVAAHLEPEILIVDEVLAVGDAEFQKKCLGKMRDIGGQGRTVLFVSHNMAAVKQLCDKGVWMKSGRVEASGPMEQVIEGYLARTEKSDTLVDLRGKEHLDNVGTLEVFSLELLNPVGGTFACSWDEPLRLRLRMRVERPLRDVTIGIEFFTQDGQQIFTLRNDDSAYVPVAEYGKPGEKVIDVVVHHNLRAGSYSLKIGIHTANLYYFYAQNFLDVEILPIGKRAYNALNWGLIKVESEWELAPEREPALTLLESR